MLFTAPHIEDLVMLPTPVLRLLNILDDAALQNDKEFEGLCSLFHIAPDCEIYHRIGYQGKMAYEGPENASSICLSLRAAFLKGTVLLQTQGDCVVEWDGQSRSFLGKSVQGTAVRESV